MPAAWRLLRAGKNPKKKATFSAATDLVSLAVNRELKQHNNGAINHVKCGLSLVLVVLVIQMRTPCPPPPDSNPSLTSCDGLHLNFSAALRCVKRHKDADARDEKQLCVTSSCGRLNLWHI